MNMITIKKFGNIDIIGASVSRSIQQMRAFLGSESETIAKAEKLVSDVFNVSTTFNDFNEARLTVFALTESVIVSAGEVKDPEAVLVAARERAQQLLNAPENKFMFVTTAKAEEVVETRAIGDGEVSIKVTSEGKIKRGGKQEAAYELYVKHVVGQSMKSADFISLLIAELGMTKLGARTYMYNAKKQHQAA
jgi:hypothetical protein